jgi:hypothetical protein
VLETAAQIHDPAVDIGIEFFKVHVTPVVLDPDVGKVVADPGAEVHR